MERGKKNERTSGERLENSGGQKTQR